MGVGVGDGVSVAVGVLVTVGGTAAIGVGDAVGTSVGVSGMAAAGVAVGGMERARVRDGVAGEVVEVCESEIIWAMLSHPSQMPTPIAASMMRTHSHPRPPLGRRGERVGGPPMGDTEPCCLAP